MEDMAWASGTAIWASIASAPKIRAEGRNTEQDGCFVTNTEPEFASRGWWVYVEFVHYFRSESVCPLLMLIYLAYSVARVSRMTVTRI